MAPHPVQNLLAQIEAHKITTESLTERLEEEKVKVQHLEHMLTSKERDLKQQTELVDKKDIEIGMLKEALARRGLEQPEEAALSLSGRYEGSDENMTDEKGKKRSFLKDYAPENPGARKKVQL